MKISIVKFFLLGVASLLAVLPFAANAVQVEGSSSVPVQAASSTDRIIVKYKDTTPMGVASSMSQAALNRASRIAGTELHHLRRLSTGAQLLRFQGRKGKAELAGVVARLQQDPNVEYAEPDLLLQPMFTPNDPGYNQQWHYFEAAGGLNLPGAWNTSRGAGVVVGVIDTGYRPHADLAANILPGYDMISDPSVAQDGNGRDSNARDPGDWAPAGACGSGSPARSSSWHGTHVAGTVAAVTNNGSGVAGVAHKAKVVPIRVLGRCGGYTSDIADAIIWGAGGSVSGVPANANPAQVLNLSLGGSGSCGSTMQNAINTARSQGATVVVAAGNSSANAGNFTPASCNGVVSVAAVDRSGGRAWYSNFGSVVDVAAPGGDTSVSGNGVLSTLNSGTQGPSGDSFAFYQGTSMASPHVAGAAALLYAVDSSLSPNSAESILKSTARSFPASCSQCGSGIVNAASAVNAASSSQSLISDNMTLNHNWKKRSYSGPSNPRVVMGTPSYNGSHPTTARIRDASANSFTVQLDEWDYLDGAHTNESISYLVAKNGSSRFGSLSVKSGEINLNHNWKTVNFGSSFSNKPVVVAQTVTRNGGAAVTTRIRNVTSTSFQVRLQEEEGADGTHATEKVHWIAIESGTTNSNGAKLVVGRTSNSVTDAWKSIGYGSVSSPKMIAAMQTFDGGDTAVLRRKNLTSSSVQVKVEEEQSDDSEVAHTTEVVGYIIMGR